MRGLGRTATGSGLVALALLLAGPGPAGADTFLYASPTVGIWRWDRETHPEVVLPDRSGLLVGGRIGYAPFPAFAGEVVVLTGTIDAEPAAQDSGARSLRLTQTELSLLVNFQSIASASVYPFLALGAGVAFRRGGPLVAGESAVNDQHLIFHLGGGLAVELARHWGLRLNVRDSFFTDTPSAGGNVRDQVTVDSLELSVGVMARLPLTKRKGPGRLR